MNDEPFTDLAQFTHLVMKHLGEWYDHERGQRDHGRSARASQRALRRLYDAYVLEQRTGQGRLFS
jgi:hypothetical protein